MTSYIPTLTQSNSHWKKNHSWNEFIQENPKFAFINHDQIPLLAAQLCIDRFYILSFKFIYDISNAIFEIFFDDDVVWVCRVHQNDESNYIKKMIESIIAMIYYIKWNIIILMLNIHIYESNSIAIKIDFAFIFMNDISSIHARI